jgi:hypothetical protein
MDDIRMPELPDWEFDTRDATRPKIPANAKHANGKIRSEEMRIGIKLPRLIG